MVPVVLVVVVVVVVVGRGFVCSKVKIKDEGVREGKSRTSKI